MIKRFEHNVWILIIVVMVVALSAVTIVAFPDTAEAQSPTEDSPEAAEGAVPAPPATSVGSFTGGYDYKRQLPGLVIAALIFGIAVFSAWKLPMSHEAGNSASRSGETSEGMRGRDVLATHSPAGTPGAGQGSSGSAWDIGGADSPDKGLPEPTTATGPGIAPSGGSRREERFEALTGKLEALRRIVEEQDRRLAAMEEENFDLRRKIEATPSLVTAPRGTTAGRR